MPATTVTASPFVSVGNVSFVLNHDDSHASSVGAVQFQCALQSLVPEADADEIDLDTACDPQGIGFGNPRYEYVATFRYSAEVYGLLKNFELSEVTFAALNDFTQPISATNREESGRVRMSALPPEVHYQNNENLTLEVRFPVIGAPVSTEDPLAAAFTPHPLGP